MIPGKTQVEDLATPAADVETLAGSLDSTEGSSREAGQSFDESGPPRQLGRYAVLGTLGSGGMGVVLEAFDRTLDRRVALKVLHRELDVRSTARLLREAQALAKLSHPNVVQVYEAGTAEGRSFIAMEFVPGRSLREWLRQQPRPGWRACVDAFVQAGEGLEAAHAQGLIHRDFKPGNAIIDDGGRVRVLDFGLARGTSESSSDAGLRTDASLTEDIADLETPLTRTGAILGTPAYMPPEQMGGRDADARSDQFALCVSLYEAIYGERPYEGDTVASLLASTLQGQVRTSPKGTGVPASLRQVLVRGLAPEPDDRWPSMDALLSQLRATIAPKSRRWWLLGGGLVVGLGLVAAGLAYQATIGRRCTGAHGELAGVWDDARRQQVQAAITQTALPYAASTWERVEPRLDAYAGAWADAYADACEATRVRQEQTEQEMSLRLRCLRQRRTTLRATVDVLARADAEVVRNAVALAASLPLLERCSDVEGLSAQRQRLPPPEDPQVAREVAELRELLVGAEAEHYAGHYAEAVERARSVAERAEALDYRPLVAETATALGVVLSSHGRDAEAERQLERAYQVALEIDHPEVQLGAASALVHVVGHDLGRHTEGLQWGKTALPLARRRGVPASMGTTLRALGSVLESLGKYDEAEEHHRRALDAFENSPQGSADPGFANTLTSLGNVLMRQGRGEEAAANHLRALEASERVLGPEHPSVANALSNLGIVRAQQGQLEEAEGLFRRAQGIVQRAMGANHPTVAQSTMNLGNVLEMQGKLAEAEEQLRWSLRIIEQSSGPDHPTVATGKTNLGRVHYLQGEHEEAARLLRHALEFFENSLEPEHPYREAGVWNLGAALRALTEYEEAEALHRRYIRTLEDAKGPDHPLMARSFTALAMIELARDDHQAARALAERAVSLHENGEVSSPSLAEARFVLARALWAEPDQRSHAWALAEQAQEVLADAPSEVTAELERWMAEHRPP